MAQQNDEPNWTERIFGDELPLNPKDETDRVVQWFSETLVTGDIGLAVDGLKNVCAVRRAKHPEDTDARTFYTMVGALASTIVGDKLGFRDVKGLKAAMGGSFKGERR